MQKLFYIKQMVNSNFLKYDQINFMNFVKKLIPFLIEIDKIPINHYFL